MKTIKLPLSARGGSITDATGQAVTNAEVVALANKALRPEPDMTQAPPAGQAEAILAALERLREDEGNSVEILCRNPDPDGPEDQAIIACGHWTDWQSRRFEGRSLLECLQAAVAAMDAALPTLLDQKGAMLQPGHRRDCDVNDRNPEGIVKPCNCGAAERGGKR